MGNENKTIQSIAIYRVLAMFIVLYYHLVEIPTYSLEIINVTKVPLETTILPDSFFAKLGVIVLNYFHVDTGSLAVMMFFIASGYLISKMMDRYTRREFLVNRAISTFPTLWVSLIVIAVFVYLSQGITFTIDDFVSSAFPFLPRSSGMFLSAVLWTMRVELKFYLFAAIFGKNRKNMVVYGYMLILLLSIAYYEFRTPQLYSQMLDASFMCFIFLGVIIECVQREKSENGLKYIAASVLVNLLLFKVSTWLFQDSGNKMSYPNCVTQILPVLVFLLLLKLEERSPMLFQRVPRFVYSIGNLVLPYYLTHVACGISVMYQLSKAGFGFYVTLFGGIFTSFAVAGLIYLLVTKPSGVLMKKTIAAMRKEK